MTELRRPFKPFAPADDRIWSMLWDKQIANCRQHASSLWLDGLDLLGLDPARIPDFEALSRRLHELSGWELVSTDVIFSDGQTWFEHLARRQFLITEYIRDEKDLLYTPLPDIWHDSFGHLPLMANPRYADYVEHFAHVALRYGKEERKSLGSLWWYTIEFGFIIFCQRRLNTIEASVVAENVKFSKTGNGVIKHGLDVFRRRHVGMKA